MPPDSVELLIVNGATVTAREMLADRDCAGLLESETIALKLAEPAAVGVPEITPLAEVRVSPAGKLLPLLSDQV